MNTTEVIQDILEHHGVKGMKWGVRRESLPVAIKSGVRSYLRQQGDKRYELIKQDPVTNLGKKIQINNRAAKLMNEHDVGRINNKPRYKLAAENGELLKLMLMLLYILQIMLLVLQCLLEEFMEVLLHN
jgi:hypothetical protein